VILVIFCQIGFVSYVGNREQAFQADGIEGAVRISSVWKKRWKRENHRAASFRGEPPTYKDFVRIDGQFSTVCIASSTSADGIDDLGQLDGQAKNDVLYAGSGAGVGRIRLRDGYLFFRRGVEVFAGVEAE
jgi:hypothetical protein